jgi:hypothetical protein
MVTRKATKRRHSTLTSHDPLSGKVCHEAPAAVFHLQQIYISNIENGILFLTGLIIVIIIFYTSISNNKVFTKQYRWVLTSAYFKFWEMKYVQMAAI